MKNRNSAPEGAPHEAGPAEELRNGAVPGMGRIASKENYRPQAVHIRGGWSGEWLVGPRGRIRAHGGFLTVDPRVPVGQFGYATTGSRRWRWAGGHAVACGRCSWLMPAGRVTWWWCVHRGRSARSVVLLAASLALSWAECVSWSAAISGRPTRCAVVVPGRGPAGCRTLYEPLLSPQCHTHGKRRESPAGRWPARWCL